MSDLLVVLTRNLTIFTNNDDFEFKLAEALKKYDERLVVRVSKMTSNRLGLNLTWTGFIDLDLLKEIESQLIETLREYYGETIRGTSIVLSIACTYIEEVVIKY